MRKELQKNYKNFRKTPCKMISKELQYGYKKSESSSA